MSDAFAAWLKTLGLNEWLTIVSALVAVASFAFNWAVVRRQTAMQFESLRAAHDSDLIKWADEVIEQMANAQKLCRDRFKDGGLGDDEFTRGRSELRTRISALLDRGRLFFPNAPLNEDQSGVEAAYRGKRQPALDAVFGVYRVITDAGRDGAPDEAVNAIVAHKRVFISEVFNTIDPRRRESIMSRLDYRRARKAQKRALNH